MIGTEFCDKCGSRNVPRIYADDFDPETGSPREYLACSNPKCGLGCPNHKMTFLGSLIGNYSCRACGKEAYL